MSETGLNPFHHAVCLAALILMAGCTAIRPDAADDPDPGRELRVLFDAYQEDYLRLHPLEATTLGDYRYNDVLGDYLSADYLRQSRSLQEHYLGRLDAIDYASLSREQQLSYDIFRYSRAMDLEMLRDGYSRLGTLLPLSQFRGMPIRFAQLGSGSSTQPFRTPKDYEDWLGRVAGFPVWVDQAIANMRTGMREGVVQPRIIIEKALPQLAAQLVDDVTASIFYGPVRDMPDSISKTDAERLERAYRTAIRTVVIPAYRRLYEFLAGEYLPRTRSTTGIGDLPGGREWYACLARMHTTTDLSAEEIHAIGLREAESLYAEMVWIKTQVGFTGSMQEFFADLRTNPRFRYPSPEAMLESFRTLQAEVDARVPLLFSLQPRAGYVIRPMEAFREASAAAAEYMPPSSGGDRPGMFYVNTYDLPARMTWQRVVLFLHEAVPGHHFQIAIAQEQENLPPFQRFNGPNAYVEGWGLYAETLGVELGLYGDPYQRLGALSAQIWRANRLVVDTGLHVMGWSRQQAIDWMLSNSPMTGTDVVAEVERYLALPGQALSYMIGRMKYQELRGRAQQALGDAFDVREFHREVLKDGAMPLFLLERKIDDWILSSRAQP